MKNISRRAFLIVLTISMLLVLFLPFLPQIIWSFSQRWLFPSLLPDEWGFRAWDYLVSPGAQLGRAMLTSLEVGILVTALSIAIGLPAGRALGLYQFRGKTLIQFLILAPAIVPGFAAAMGVHQTFIRFGLADTMLGVVLVHLIPVMPYVVLTLSGVFSNYNLEYEEAARSLGANSWNIFRNVTMPTILPGLLVAALFAFTISWGQYLLTLLIGGGQVLTMPVLLLNFINSGDYALASALSLVLIFPAGLVLWFTSHFMGSQDVALGGFGRL